MKALSSFIAVFLTFICLLPSAALAQSAHAKGEFYLYWGWNRACFTRSDLHFMGDGYDFVLDNVVAKDRQTPFGIDPYFNPALFTIPQYNYRFGYSFSDKFNISLGMDHMKYVMQANQVAPITGTISGSGSNYDGVYDHDSLRLSRDFLKFEHTDGLNYLNAEIRRSQEIFDYKWLNFSLTAGGGVGVLIPKTNTTLLKNPRYDEFHLAGYGFGGIVGGRVTLFKFCFVQPELKGGFIHMPDIRTTASKSDKASQHFFFGQFNTVLGASFPLVRSK